MQPERWQKIKALFNEAVELTAEEQEALLKAESDAEIAADQARETILGLSFRRNRDKGAILVPDENPNTID